MRPLRHVLFLLCSLCIGPHVATAMETSAPRGFDAVATASRQLQADWSKVFYSQARETQTSRYETLLTQIRHLKSAHPDRAEPLIVEAIILCTYSAAALGLDTLEMLETARNLLEKAIQQDPHALEGAAYVTLGNLYRRLPGWPILYGDRATARRYLTTGVKLFPEGMDTNYFMGDFLIEEGDLGGAQGYLEKAVAAPIRPSLRLSDEQVHKEAVVRLRELKSGEASHSDLFELFTPSFR